MQFNTIFTKNHNNKLQMSHRGNPIKIAITPKQTKKSRIHIQQ